MGGVWLGVLPAGSRTPRRRADRTAARTGRTAATWVLRSDLGGWDKQKVVAAWHSAANTHTRNRKAGRARGWSCPMARWQREDEGDSVCFTSGSGGRKHREYACLCGRRSAGEGISRRGVALALAGRKMRQAMGWGT